jgi:hypothetical protein
MAHQDTDTPELHLCAGREDLSPPVEVAVAANSGDGGERAQLREHLGRTHVSGVDYVSDAFEKRLDLGIEMTVSVGEDADADEAGAAAGPPCGIALPAGARTGHR